MDRTVRLFDMLPSESEFEAVVLSCLPDGKGNYTVVLDKTLFFPEEGGQACDTGLLGGAEVVYVCEKERVIYHTVSVFVKCRITQASTLFRGLYSKISALITSDFIWARM